MQVNLEKFDSGWVSLTVAIPRKDIDNLIARLQDLKSGSTGHFHFRTDDFSCESGVADIEFSVAGPSEVSNMVLE